MSNDQSGRLAEGQFEDENEDENEDECEEEDN